MAPDNALKAAFLQCPQNSAADAQILGRRRRDNANNASVRHAAVLARIASADGMESHGTKAAGFRRGDGGPHTPENVDKSARLLSP